MTRMKGVTRVTGVTKWVKGVTWVIILGGMMTGVT